MPMRQALLVLTPPLVNNMPLDDGKHGTEKSAKKIVRIQWFSWLLAIGGACLLGLFLFAQQDAQFLAQDVSMKYQRVHNRPEISLDTCSTLCPSLQNTTSFYESTRQLLQRAQVSRGQVISQLKTQYGEKYYNDLFITEEGESIGKTAFLSPDYNPETKENTSKDRFVRKLMLKVLSVQLRYQECDCHSTQFTPSAPVRMVWATGGHSSAAGHGNFYHESYTAVFERTARSVFSAVGIELEGRNYAMGAMNSAPELALCAEAVYGLDADVISWDFGMTDGRGWWRKFFYGNRIGMHRNRPAIVEFGVTDGRAIIAGPRLEQLTKLQEMGLTGLYLQYGLFEQPGIKDKLPDMKKCNSQDEIDAIPEFLRHFKCGQELEKGDPTCDANKFTRTNCKMSHRVSWHPGWKAHAFRGNTMALFMMDSLLEAIDKLAALFRSDETLTPRTVFDYLKAQEDENYESFYNSAINDIDPDFIPKELAKELNATVLFRNRAVCHTALLPSETRYLGILTDTRSTSSFEHFEAGMDYRRDTATNGTWSLVYDSALHDKNKKCPATELIDFKDWFFIQTRSAEASLTIPNNAEKELYLDKIDRVEGLLVICLVKCPWGKCDTGTLLWEEVNNGDATFVVNGEPVIEATSINGCALLKGKDGFSWPPSGNGQYQVTAKVRVPNSFLKVSSLILL